MIKQQHSIRSRRAHDNKTAAIGYSISVPKSNSHPQAHVKEELDMQPAPERHSGAPYNEIRVDLHMPSTCSLQYIQYLQCIQYKRCRQYAQDTESLHYIQYMQC